MVFISGLELCGLFYSEVLKPLLDLHYPNLPYSAALIGNGSEILGFDTEMSTDHDWGPRMTIFIENDSLQNEISVMFSKNLPSQFRSYPTGFTVCEEDGVQVPDLTNSSDFIRHRIQIMTMKAYFLDYLNYDITQSDIISSIDWLTFPQQKLRTIIEGRVYHDGLSLNSVRERFAYYPKNVWLYQLAAIWNKIENDEHLMGRCGSVGDELGASLIASRLVTHIMNLCFLMERKYAPYMKWFGSAFKQLDISTELLPILNSVMNCGHMKLLSTDNNIHTTTNNTIENWKLRQQYLSQAYECIARKHNSLHITEQKLPETVKQFHTRPFLVISMGLYSQTILKTLQTELSKAVNTVSYMQQILNTNSMLTNNRSDVNSSFNDDRFMLALVTASTTTEDTALKGRTLAPTLGGIDMYTDYSLDEARYRHILTQFYMENVKQYCE